MGKWQDPKPGHPGQGTSLEESNPALCTHVWNHNKQDLQPLPFGHDFRAAHLPQERSVGCGPVAAGFGERVQFLHQVGGGVGADTHRQIDTRTPAPTAHIHTRTQTHTNYLPALCVLPNLHTTLSNGPELQWAQPSVQVLVLFGSTAVWARQRAGRMHSTAVRAIQWAGRMHAIGWQNVLQLAGRHEDNLYQMLTKDSCVGVGCAVNIIWVV